VWPHTGTARTWLVDGKPVRDEEVSGIFVRRYTVYPEELMSVHPGDRVFMAAEGQAFLTFVLATTSARVVNPVIDGAFGEESLRPERWTAAAAAAGLAVRPLRATSERRRQPRFGTYGLELVGRDVIGAAPRNVVEKVPHFAEVLGIEWGVLLFDRRHRLVTVTSTPPPDDAAAVALGRLLEEKRR
jgi:hypothetical protein